MAKSNCRQSLKWIDWNHVIQHVWKCPVTLQGLTNCQIVLGGDMGGGAEPGNNSMPSRFFISKPQPLASHGSSWIPHSLMLKAEQERVSTEAMKHSICPVDKPGKSLSPLNCSEYAALGSVWGGDAWRENFVSPRCCEWVNWLFIRSRTWHFPLHQSTHMVGV